MGEQQADSVGGTRGFIPVSSRPEPEARSSIAGAVADNIVGLMVIMVQWFLLGAESLVEYLRPL